MIQNFEVELQFPELLIVGKRYLEKHLHEKGVLRARGVDCKVFRFLQFEQFQKSVVCSEVHQLHRKQLLVGLKLISFLQFTQKMYILKW